MLIDLSIINKKRQEQMQMQNERLISSSLSSSSHNGSSKSSVFLGPTQHLSANIPQIFLGAEQPKKHSIIQFLAEGNREERIKKIIMLTLVT